LALGQDGTSNSSKNNKIVGKMTHFNIGHWGWGAGQIQHQSAMFTYF